METNEFTKVSALNAAINMRRRTDNRRKLHGGGESCETPNGGTGGRKLR